MLHAPVATWSGSWPSGILRVEFTKMGRNGTLVRIIQGPYEPKVAGFHSTGWELELERLEGHLAGAGAKRVNS